MKLEPGLRPSGPTSRLASSTFSTQRPGLAASAVESSAAEVRGYERSE